jgi:hypothetical protein
MLADPTLELHLFAAQVLNCGPVDETLATETTDLRDCHSEHHRNV